MFAFTELPAHTVDRIVTVSKESDQQTKYTYLYENSIGFWARKTKNP